MTTAQRDDVLTQISVDVKGLSVAIKGNGTKGLNDRVDDLEKDNKSRPSWILKRRAVDATVLGVIFVGMQLLGRWQGWW